MTALWTILLRSLMEFLSYHLEAQFCPICNKGGESSSECQFYRKDSRLAYEGKLPTEYANIRRHLIKRRYLVLDERAETHKLKFVIQTTINNFGEKTSLEELENTVSFIVTIK
jgi:hypothetical protein